MGKRSNAFYLRNKGESGGTTPLECFCLADLAEPFDRGFLESYKEGKNRFYTPLVAEKEYLAVENKAFLEKVNNHSVTKLVASLYDSHSITEEDLDELAAFIRSKTGGA